MVRNRMSANNSILAVCAKSFRRRSSGSQIGFTFFGSAAAIGVTFSTAYKGSSDRMQKDAEGRYRLSDPEQIDEEIHALCKALIVPQRRSEPKTTPTFPSGGAKSTSTALANCCPFAHDCVFLIKEARCQVRYFV